MSMRRIFLSLMLCAALGPTASFAEKVHDKVVEIAVTMQADPKSALGILMSSSGNVQVPVKAIERVNDSTVVVSVPYDDSSAARDTMVTAMILSEDGTPFFGGVRPLFAPDSKESSLHIPNCAPEKISEAAMQGQLSLLESLVEVRSQRRGVAQVKVAQVLDGKFLSDLKKLEHGFGFNYSQELSSDLNPVELIDRLSRISEAVSIAKQSKPAEKAAKAK